MSDPANPAAGTPAEPTATPAILSEPSAAAAEPVAAPETPPAVDPAAEAAATETPAAEAAAETPAEAEKPAETPAAEPGKEAGAAEAEKPAETPPAVVYEPFTLPEGVVADGEAMGRFTEVIGELGLSQEGGQKLMDLYAVEQGRLATAMAEHQHQVFQETQKEWVQAFENDPDLGRNRRDTTLNAARTAIGWAFGLGIPGKELEPAAQAAAEARRQEFWDAMTYTGLGNHVASVRAWTQVHRMLAPFLAEPKAPPGGAPPRGEGLRAADRRYGNGG